MREKQKKMNKEINLKGKKGITLIALVITIIVLLILAGVTVATLTGDNGLLQKATNSKGETIKAEGLERLKLAVVASYDNNGKVDTQNLAKNLSEIEGLKYINNENQEVNIEENTEIELTAKFKLNGYNYKISDEGKVTYKKEGAIDNEDIIKSPSTYYGKYVTNYNSPNDAGIRDAQDQLGKWQIFMSDDDNIYLIASNYISLYYTKEQDGVVFLNSGNIEDTKNAYRIGIDATNITMDIPTVLSKFNNNTRTQYHKWMNTEDNQTYTNSSPNKNHIAAITDVDLWDGYKNSIFAEYSIGGPTLEMFCKSYNDVHDSIKIRAREQQNGYKIQRNSEEDEFNVNDLKTDLLIDSNMYFKESNIKSLWYYWLASPSDYYSKSRFSMVLRVFYGGTIDPNYTNYNSMGFRPLVCLKSNVHLVEKTNGTTTTYELELD